MSEDTDQNDGIEDVWDRILANEGVDTVPARFDDRFASSDEFLRELRDQRFIALAFRNRVNSFTDETLARFRSESDILGEQVMGRIRQDRRRLGLKRIALLAMPVIVFAIVAFVVTQGEEDEAANSVAGRIEMIPVGEVVPRFVVSEGDSSRDRTVRLSRGMMQFSIPTGSFDQFSVETDHLRATVRGTKFSVEGSEIRSIVRVEEGAVEVAVPLADSGRPFLLVEGEQIHFREGGRPSRTARVAPVTVALEIDGEAEPAWQNARPIPLAPDGDDLAGSWRALHSGDSLYLLVEISDDEVVGPIGGQIWQYDSVEVYLDADRSRGNRYDEVDDSEIFFPANDHPLSAQRISAIADLSGIEWAASQKRGGYQIEIAIPKGAVGIPPGETSIGFDIAINDRDTDSPDQKREDQIRWNDRTGEGWRSPDRFGTLHLQTFSTPEQP